MICGPKITVLEVPGSKTMTIVGVAVSHKAPLTFWCHHLLFLVLLPLLALWKITWLLSIYTTGECQPFIKGAKCLPCTHIFSFQQWWCTERAVLHDRGQDKLYTISAIGKIKLALKILYLIHMKCLLQTEMQNPNHKCASSGGVTLLWAQPIYCFSNKINFSFQIPHINPWKWKAPTPKYTRHMHDFHGYIIFWPSCARLQGK